METPTASLMPSLLCVSEYDPNAQKNRIPTESELSGLRGLAETLSRSIENVKEDIKRTQAMHDILLAKYKCQLRELEGTQSQLHEFKRILRLIEDQLMSLEAERSRVAGITHPIRRCPSEVLQCIFETTCDQEGTPDKIWCAFGLSQVCQRWRAIAVDTARLWCVIEYTISSNEAMNSSFWRCVTPRMKRAPATIILHDLDINGAHKILQCSLAQIPVIDRASLYIPGPGYFDLISSLPGFLPEDGINEFKIMSSKEFVSRAEENETLWDVGRLLSGLPSLSSLYLAAPCTLRVTPTENLQAITTFYLAAMADVDVPYILSLFTRLSRLELDQVQFAESETTTHVVARSLQLLMLQDSEADRSWTTRISCPELASFILNGVEFLDEWRSFIQGHPSIVNLEFDGDSEVLVELTTAAPQIESLTISSSVEVFINWRETEMTGPPFTRLKHLTFMGHMSMLTLAQFESIAVGRCLPSGASRCEIAPNLLPLETFSIAYHPVMATNPANEQWRDSELFKSGRPHVAPHSYWDDLQAITLSWV